MTCTVICNAKSADAPPCPIPIFGQIPWSTNFMQDFVSSANSGEIIRCVLVEHKYVIRISVSSNAHNCRKTTIWKFWNFISKVSVSQKPYMIGTFQYYSCDQHDRIHLVHQKLPRKQKSYYPVIYLIRRGLIAHQENLLESAAGNRRWYNLSESEVDGGKKETPSSSSSSSFFAVPLTDENGRSLTVPREAIKVHSALTVSIALNQLISTWRKHKSSRLSSQMLPACSNVYSVDDQDNLYIN